MLHGQTSALDVDVEFKENHYQGFAQLRQHDFGMTPVRIAGGTVKPAGDKFIVRVHRPGRAILYISNKKKSKDHWEVSFEVRPKS